MIDSLARYIVRLFGYDFDVEVWKRPDLGFFTVDHLRHNIQSRELWGMGLHLVIDKH